MKNMETGIIGGLGKGDVDRDRGYGFFYNLSFGVEYLMGGRMGDILELLVGGGYTLVISGEGSMGSLYMRGWEGDCIDIMYKKERGSYENGELGVEEFEFNIGLGDWERIRFCEEFYEEEFHCIGGRGEMGYNYHGDTLGINVRKLNRVRVKGEKKSICV